MNERAIATAQTRARTEIVHWLTAVDARTARVSAVVGALIVIAIGLPLSAALNIWLDEAFTLHTTGAGVAAAWQRAVAFEDQPPLYFVIEAAWRWWNETSVVFARLPSVLFAAAAVALIVCAAHRIAPRTPPPVVAAIAAFHPLVIWAAVEMRVYAMVLLIGAGLTALFFAGFLGEKRSRRAQVGYTLLALAGLYTQYFVGFLLAAHCLTLIVLRGRGVWAFLGAMVVVAAGFAPFVGAALMQIHSTGDSVGGTTPLEAVRQLLDLVLTYTFPHDHEWVGAAKFAGLGLAAGWFAMLVFVGRPQRLSRPARGAMLALAFGVMLFGLVFAAVGMPFDLRRHLIVLLPTVLLAVFALLSSLRRARRWACVATIVLFALCAGGQFASEYHAPLAKQGDWQRVATELSADDRATPVAVFPAELALPLDWYLGHAAVPIPRPMPFILDYVAATMLTSDADVARVLDPVRVRSDRVWIVTENECLPTDLKVYDYHCDILETFLAHHYRLETTRFFRGIVMRRFVRLPVPPLASAHAGWWNSGLSERPLSTN